MLKLRRLLPGIIVVGVLIAAALSAGAPYMTP
jgi:hypothetical protein